MDDDHRYSERKCHCGSGETRWSLVDARGIFLCYCCDTCEKRQRSKYRSDIFHDGNYECDEQVEPDE